MVKGQKANDLTYREFYSTDLFEKAKEDIGYCGQWSVAYGFYPAILEYNDIATLDGYLGFYSQNYKEEFRKMIAPALDRVEESRRILMNGERVPIFIPVRIFPLLTAPVLMR